MYVCVCVCVCVCVYVYIYIHIYVYVQVDQRRSAALRKASCLIATSLEEGLAAVAAASAAGMRPGKSYYMRPDLMAYYSVPLRHAVRGSAATKRLAEVSGLKATSA